MKFINKDQLDPSELSSLQDEVEMLRRMDHPNILRLYAYYDEPKYFCLVTEICTGGELFEQVVKQPVPLLDKPDRIIEVSKPDPKHFRLS